MARNYSLDMLKALLMFGIVLIHTGSYVVTSENFNVIEQYVFSFTSLFVPCFFIISGYFFYKSRNRTSTLKNLLITYCYYSLFIILVNFLISPTGFSFDGLNILLIGNNVGFFWYLNSLLYYYILIIIIVDIKNRVINNLTIFLFVLLMLSCIYLITTNHLIDKDVLSFTYFFVGFLAAKYNFTINKKLIYIIVIYPFLVRFQYVEVSIFALIFGFIIFSFFNNISVNENIISRFSSQGLKILAIHFYIVTFFSSVSISTDSYFLSYIFVLVATLILLKVLNTIIALCMYVIDVYNKDKE